LLVARPRWSRTTSRAGHPGWRRCSALKYSRYSRSSRLAIRAPRSAIWSSFSVDGPLVSAIHPIGTPKECMAVRRSRTIGSGAR